MPPASWTRTIKVKPMRRRIFVIALGNCYGKLYAPLVSQSQGNGGEFLDRSDNLGAIPATCRQGKISFSYKSNLITLRFKY